MVKRTKTKPTKNRLPENEVAIHSESVSKSFGDIHALDNISLQAQKGKVTGLLGPNGAGKSTLIRVMTTLLQADSGRVSVDGVDALQDPAEARKHLGLAGQSSAVDDFLKGRETLEMVGKLYGMSKAESKKRSQELLRKLDLTDAADRQAKTYSGGMRRRLDLGASLVASPQVIFMDEPTTGLDPRTRLQLWDVIRELAESGVTVLLTTQYLEEADALCDYIYVIDQGKMVAEGTAGSLKSGLGQDVIELKVEDMHIEKAQEVLHNKLKREIEVEGSIGKLRMRTKNGADDIVLVSSTLKDVNIKPEELSLHRPSLDDVFLEVTGGHKKEAK